MGFRPSPYHAVRHYDLAEEFVSSLMGLYYFKFTWRSGLGPMETGCYEVGRPAQMCGWS